MRCEIVKDLLEKFVEGELEEPLKEDIEKHIAGCDSCKHELLLARKVPFMIRSMLTPQVPGDIIHDVLEQISKPLKKRFSYEYLFSISLPKKVLFASAVPIVLVILIIGITRLRPSGELQNEPKPLYVEKVDNSNKPKAQIKPIEKPNKVLITKDNSYVQNRKKKVRIVNKESKETEIADNEILSAVDQINLALGIFGTALKEVQSSTFTESERVLNITKNKSQYIIETLSSAQTEVANSLKLNLNFINQLQIREESTQ